MRADREANLEAAALLAAVCLLLKETVKKTHGDQVSLCGREGGRGGVQPDMTHGVFHNLNALVSHVYLGKSA